MELRVLTREEIPRAVPLMEAYVAASEVPIQFRAEKAVAIWQRLYDEQRGAFCGLFAGAELVGLFGVHQMESAFGDLAMANEWIWWVQPAYRSGSWGLRLLTWGESWAKERHLGLCLGAYDCLNGSALQRLYHKRGYHRHGSLFTNQWETDHV